MNENVQYRPTTGPTGIQFGSGGTATKACTEEGEIRRLVVQLSVTMQGLSVRVRELQDFLMPILGTELPNDPKAGAPTMPVQSDIGARLSESVENLAGIDEFVARLHARIRL